MVDVMTAPSAYGRWRHWVLSGSGTAARPDARGCWVLEHKRPYWVSCAVAFLTTCTMCWLLLWLKPRATASGWGWLDLALFTMIVVPMGMHTLARCFWDRVEITEEGLLIRCLCKRTWILPWSDIDRIEPVPGEQRLIVTAWDGSKRSVSLYLGGFGTLSQELRQKVQLAVWAPAIRALP